MNPLQSGLPAQYSTRSINTGQPLVAGSSYAQHAHPEALSLARLSRNAYSALDQVEAQPNGHHQLLALLVRGGIADSAMRLQSTQDESAHYVQQVDVPDEGLANLTVRARLNHQAQYDIVGVDLHVPSTGRLESIALSSAPPPASTRNPAARFTQGQLAQAMIQQSNPQSDSAVSSSARNEQYWAASQLNASPSVLKGANSKRVQDPGHPEKMITLAALRRREKVEDPETGELLQLGTLRERQKVTDPVTGEIVSKAALRERQKVTDPETGKKVSPSTLFSRQKAKDPGTNEIISQGAMYARKRVIDPETGETISQTALYQRRKVEDPDTGEIISISTLRGRKKVTDPGTGQVMFKKTLRNRQKVEDPETGEIVSQCALYERKKVIDPVTGDTVSKSALRMRQKMRRKKAGETTSLNALPQAQSRSAAEAENL